jgi:small subunit ribosomal protein S7
MTKKEKPKTTETKGKTKKAKTKEVKNRAPISKKTSVKKERKHKTISLRLFGKWDSDIEVHDPGLRPYINLKPKFLPRSAGVYQKRRFHKSKMHIVERLALHLMVSGHSGKKHKTTSGRFGGRFTTVLKAVEDALTKLEEKEKKNPVEVLVRAIENAALREEITSYQVGSIIARSAVITSPQRRIDKTLRYFAQGAYKRTFKTKKSLADSLAEEVLGAYHNSPECLAIKEKDRVEREAMGAR